MRFELVRNLKGNEVLAKTLVTTEGMILLKAGTRITRGYINLLKQNGVFSLYLENTEMEEGKLGVKIAELKEETLRNMPEVFNGLIGGELESIKKSMQTVKRLVDYIIDSGDVNINLYELNQYDDYTYSHCVNTGIMATLMGINLKMSKEELRQLGTGAMLHDIGKTKISTQIINKKETLTEDEFEEIKNHPIYGYHILQEMGMSDENILSVVLQHHERIDGSGYPFGLTGDQISKYAKIVSVCDVFTAISANRSYRNRFNPNEAYEYILSGVNTMFDKDIIGVFKNTFSIYPLGCSVKLNNGVEGFVVKQNKGFPDRPTLRVTYDYNTKKPITTPQEIDLLKHTNLTIDSFV